MKKALIAAASGLLLCSAAAMAQTTATTTSTTSPSSATAPSAKSHQATNESLRAQISSDMQQAGFTDVKVMPDSFLVQAKDKSGDPVSMIVNPNSVTEVVHVAANTPSSQPQKPAR